MIRVQSHSILHTHFDIHNICVCVCVCACVHACVHAYARMHVCVHVCIKSAKSINIWDILKYLCQDKLGTKIKLCITDTVYYIILHYTIGKTIPRSQHNRHCAHRPHTGSSVGHSHDEDGVSLPDAVFGPLADAGVTLVQHHALNVLLLIQPAGQPELIDTENTSIHIHSYWVHSNTVWFSQLDNRNSLTLKTPASTYTVTEFTATQSDSASWTTGTHWHWKHQHPHTQLLSSQQHSLIQPAGQPELTDTENTSIHRHSYWVHSNTVWFSQLDNRNSLTLKTPASTYIVTEFTATQSDSASWTTGTHWHWKHQHSHTQLLSSQQHSLIQPAGQPELTDTENTSIHIHSYWVHSNTVGFSQLDNRNSLTLKTPAFTYTVTEFTATQSENTTHMTS